jgi:hypothetical protein
MNQDVFDMLSYEELSWLNSHLDEDDEIQSITVVFKTRNYYYVKKSKKALRNKK